MKKIIATVLAMVMALALCTTAFADIPLWTGNTSTADVDLFDGQYNTKTTSGVMTFHAAKAPTVDSNGNVTKEGEVAYYTFEAATGKPTDLNDTKFILVNSIPAEATASNYVLVKTADENVAVGSEVDKQSAASQTLIMKKVKAVKYAYTGEVFTAWGDLCGQYKKPADVEDVTYVKYTAKTTTVVCSTAAEPNDTYYLNNILVGGEVYTGVANETAVKHAWAASAWDKKGIATEYTCATCKTVAKVINASVNAPAGSTVERIGDTLIAFTYTPGTAGTANNGSASSPKTFDAGIAMYVGMALTSVAGSAVVIGKKKEF